MKFREKRKWQIALRRYVLEKNKCSFYAPYFGLDIPTFRQWIELQFDSETNWENFSKAWQFDHIVPITYFNFENESDLRLCWNFTNIRVEDLDKNSGGRIDILASKAYFELLFQKTKYQICQKMVEKIEGIELSEIASNEKLENFIYDHKAHLETIAAFSSYDFDKLNKGIPVDKIIWEKEFLKKFEQNI